MIQSFADETTADIFHGRDTKAARRIGKELWPIVRRKLDALNRATSTRELSSIPGNRYELLKGDRRGQSSVRVNDQYRITFQFNQQDAYDVRVEDYHS